MFHELKEISKRPEVYSRYSVADLWTDEHRSKKMLECHLDESLDLSSRKKAFIDKSVQWIINRFSITSGSSICDFGCGPGLYTTQFAEAGAKVTGLDFSERSLNYAKQTAKQKNLDIDYILGNYLDFTTDKKFDLITLIFCDFCPLSPEQRKKLLSIFHTYLKDDGSILLDVASLHAYDQRKEETQLEHATADGFWSADEYYAFINTFKYDTEKVILDKHTLIEASRRYEVYNWLQYYDRDTLTKEFEQNGFKIVEYYGDVAGAPYSDQSDQIAIIAQKT